MTEVQMARGTGKTRDGLLYAAGRAAQAPGQQFVFVVRNPEQVAYCKELMWHALGSRAVPFIVPRRAFRWPNGSEVRFMVADERLHERLRGVRAEVVVDHAVRRR
jgi:hypothetical protein